ncbi:MAG: hypothetical protein ABI561_08000 [Bradyrhizobium sp.]
MKKTRQNKKLAHDPEPPTPRQRGLRTGYPACCKAPQPARERPLYFYVLGRRRRITEIGSTLFIGAFPPETFARPVGGLPFFSTLQPSVF